jgi:serine/threonine protein kinase
MVQRAQGDPRTLVVGRYALFGEIAAGGMASVHFGRLLGPAGFSRVVAVKRLHAQLAKQAEFVSMFVDEVRLAARIQHPNVVPTLDVVEEQGELFLVMEYVHGESLAQLIRLARSRGLHVPPGIATSIACGLLHGLHAAHQAESETGVPLGIIHRDVSPQNVLVGSDGITRVLDFGVARATGRLSTTRDGQLKGKPAYLAPERIEGREADRRSDVYGAAVVLWETLTGARLFDAENDAAVMAQVVSGAMTSPGTLAPGISPALEAITLRGMDRDPEKRFVTAREMALALEQQVGLVAPNEVGDWVADIAREQLESRARYLAELDSMTLASPHDRSTFGSGSSGREPHTRVVPFATTAGSPPFATSNAPEPGTKRRRAPMALAMVVVAALAAATVLLFRYRPSTPAADSGATGTTHPIADAPGTITPISSPPLLADTRAPESSATIRARPAPKSAPMGRHAETERPVVPAQPETAPPDPCRPPYTLDSAGRKRFKVDCIIDVRH